MNFTRVYAVFLRQIFVIRNLPSRVVPYFLYAVLDIVLWGFITRYLDGVGTGFSFIPVLLGAVVFWEFLQRVQQGITIPFLEDIWARNLLNMFASPIRLREYILGFVAASTATSLFGLLVMLVLAKVAFGLSLFVLGLKILPFLLILFLFGVVLGIVGACVVLRFGPYAEWFIWPIPAILSPFVGVFYPVATLPYGMQLVSSILPPSYVFEGMRAALLTGQFSVKPLLISFALTILYLWLSYVCFALIYRSVVRKGLIARFSAEGG